MEGANPPKTAAAFASPAGLIEISNITGGHFGLLFYPAPEFDFPSKAQATFLAAHL